MTENDKSGRNSPPADGGTGNDKPTLDDLLASYKKGDGESKPAMGAKPSDDSDEVAALKAKLTQMEQREADRDYRDTFRDRVIPVVKGDLDLDDDYIEYWVNRQAKEDPRLAEVWDEKDSNPSRFKATMEALAEKLAREKGKSSDKSRVANAVRNARNNDAPPTSYDDVDWASLSQEQFELKKRALYKAAERGELR